jgi:Flp pilus assembly protein TadB
MTRLDRVRLVLALAGLIFLVAGVATDSPPVVWVAIALLGAALVLRLYLKKRGE